jgi:hypothetical protein
MRRHCARKRRNVTSWELNFASLAPPWRSHCSRKPRTRRTTRSGYGARSAAHSHRCAGVGTAVGLTTIVGKTCNKLTISPTVIYLGHWLDIDRSTFVMREGGGVMTVLLNRLSPRTNTVV